MPGSPNKVPVSKKVKANATNSRLKTLPAGVLKKVLNQASPTSTLRISEVNKLLREMTKNGLGLRASVGDTVYNKGQGRRLPWGLELYKKGKNGKLKPLQKHSELFTYYNQGKFVKPMHNWNKQDALQKLGLTRLPTQKNIAGDGWRYLAYSVGHPRTRA
tara:strand:+ start:432 stop:911 length:480 start_codon:yes stop_codon:yes gene_type:complete